MRSPDHKSGDDNNVLGPNRPCAPLTPFPCAIPSSPRSQTRLNSQPPPPRRSRSPAPRSRGPTSSRSPGHQPSVAAPAAPYAGPSAAAEDLERFFVFHRVPAVFARAAAHHVDQRRPEAIKIIMERGQAVFFVPTLKPIRLDFNRLKARVTFSQPFTQLIVSHLRFHQQIIIALTGDLKTLTARTRSRRWRGLSWIRSCSYLRPTQMASRLFSFVGVPSISGRGCCGCLMHRRGSGSPTSLTSGG